MKKGIAILLLSMLVLSSCGNSGSDAPKENTQQQSEDVSKDEQEKATDSGTLGEYGVTIKGARIVKNTYEGYDMLAVSFDFTNNSENPVSFDTPIIVTAFQDGVQIEQDFDMNNEEIDLTGDTKQIQKGTTLEVNIAFKLSNSTSPVDIECREFLGDSDTKLTKTFDIAQL